MQKPSTTFQVVIAMSLIAMSVSINEAFAGSYPTDAFVSNVILTPDGEYMMTQVQIGENVFPTASANRNGQSPFMPVSPGTYNVQIGSLDEQYIVVFAACEFQKSNGSMSPIGTWDRKNTILDASLAVQGGAYRCTWTLEHAEIASGIELPTAEAEEQKLLKISGAGNLAYYTVVVSGQIVEGPNVFGPINISADGTSVNAAVSATGYDEFYFTGEIVSITSNIPVNSEVDGIKY